MRFRAEPISFSVSAAEAMGDQVLAEGGAGTTLLGTVTYPGKLAGTTTQRARLGSARL
jgi:hypothetical protein